MNDRTMAEKLWFHSKNVLCKQGLRYFIKYSSLVLVFRAHSDSGHAQKRLLLHNFWKVLYLKFKQRLNTAGSPTKALWVDRMCKRSRKSHFKKQLWSNIELSI